MHFCYRGRREIPIDEMLIIIKNRMDICLSIFRVFFIMYTLKLIDDILIIKM
jgi:hypothetical protein